MARTETDANENCATQSGASDDIKVEPGTEIEYGGKTVGTVTREKQLLVLRWAQDPLPGYIPAEGVQAVYGMSEGLRRRLEDSEIAFIRFGSDYREFMPVNSISTHELIQPGHEFFKSPIPEPQRLIKVREE